MRNKWIALAWPGAALALGAAALFGASTPFAKLLLGSGVNPLLLAGLLYLGSGFGLLTYFLIRRSLSESKSEAPLNRLDLPWLGLVILAGGVVGPILLMFGLARTEASAAALLLNLEGLATLGIAWMVFHENVDRRIFIGAFAILTGALLLSWQGGPGRTSWGALLIAGACLAWGIDNNLTRKLSSSDPVQIAMIKGLSAGAVNLTIAFVQGARLPKVSSLATAALVGFLGYGISLVLFVLALRHLGSARTGAYFSISPFVGATLAVVMFREPVTVRLIVAAVLMGIGLWLHLTEVHEHDHEHEETVHEHRHVHDEHHQHQHSADDPSGEPHTHVHRHERLIHRHPHYPDLHHRHTH